MVLCAVRCHREQHHCDHCSPLAHRTGVRHAGNHGVLPHWCVCVLCVCVLCVCVCVLCMCVLSWACVSCACASRRQPRSLATLVRVCLVCVRLVRVRVCLVHGVSCLGRACLVRVHVCLVRMCLVHVCLWLSRWRQSQITRQRCWVMHPERTSYVLPLHSPSSPLQRTSWQWCC